MPTGLQPPQECTTSCDGVTTAVPGPTGAAGAAGSNGTNGTNAYTSLTAQFTMPAAQSSVSTAARSSNVATIVTAANHDLQTGDTVDITGIVTAGFNDTGVTVTVTNVTTFTYANTGADIGATPETAGRVDPENTATVADASFLPVGGTPTAFPIVFLQNCGYLELMGASGNTLTLRNLGWSGNVAVGAAVAIANKLGLGGPPGDDGAAGASGAPVGAQYLVRTADATLTSEFNLGGLASGILKHTVGAGVSTPAVAVANTDYLAADAGLVNLAGVAMAANEFYVTSADNVHVAKSVTVKAQELLDDADAATMRATLGLGSAATFASGSFLQAANNLSDLADAATARTNLGVSASGDSLLAANNLSDLAAAATARSNLGINPAWSKYVMLSDQQVAGTDGGTFTSGAWQTRVLNTEVDPDGICTLSSNQFTLDAGTYFIIAFAPAHEVNNHKARLRNTTGGSTLLVGTSQESAAADDTSSDSLVIGVFTVAGGQALEIQHQCETTEATDGFGEGYDFGEVEVYTRVFLIQLV